MTLERNNGFEVGTKFDAALGRDLWGQRLDGIMFELGQMGFITARITIKCV